MSGLGRWLSASGLATGLIQPGDAIANRFIAAAPRPGGMRVGDCIVVAESAVATAEGRIVRLDGVKPAPAARDLAGRYAMDPRMVEIILQESDAVVGGMPGFLLCRAHGTLLPNAGVDASNAPPGCVLLLPADPGASAARIRKAIRASAGVEVAVIVADSRPHPMRSVGPIPAFERVHAPRPLPSPCDPPGRAALGCRAPSPACPPTPHYRSGIERFLR